MRVHRSNTYLMAVESNLHFPLFLIGSLSFSAFKTLCQLWVLSYWQCSLWSPNSPHVCLSGLG